MTPVYVHNPMDILWQTDLFDLLMLVIFVTAAIHSGMQFRRGRRIYATLMIAAFIYGVVLELGGMATHHSYTQGPFTVMLNVPSPSLFRNSTQMPSYVPIFYPVVLFIGFKVCPGGLLSTGVRCGVSDRRGGALGCRAARLPGLCERDHGLGHPHRISGRRGDHRRALDSAGRRCLRGQRLARPTNPAVTSTDRCCPARPPRFAQKSQKCRHRDLRRSG
jgi:hypothetical protein